MQSTPTDGLAHRVKAEEEEEDSQYIQQQQLLLLLLLNSKEKHKTTTNKHINKTCELQQLHSITTFINIVTVHILSHCYSVANNLIISHISTLLKRQVASLS